MSDKNERMSKVHGGRVTLPACRGHRWRHARRDDARLAARRAFGSVEQAKDRQRDTRGFRWLENSRIDLKLGVRMLAEVSRVVPRPRLRSSVW
jgi:hypothetical protein